MKFIIAALGLLCLSSESYALDWEKIVGATNSIVMVRGYNPDGSMAYGSGVIVAQNKVMTNCHIFRQTKKPWVSHGEDSYAVLSVQADRYHDLCLLEVDNLAIPPAPIGKSTDLKKNQEMIAIGHSSGVPSPITSLGTLKSLYPFHNNGNVIRTNARFALGASGSGLFDDSGNLIGINTFKTPGRFAYFYALPVEWLDDLQKLPIENQFPIIGKAFWEEDDDQKPFFMQMALPEINEDWPKLGQVAETWIKTEPTNTEAWYELGLAEENMGHSDLADKAYQKSIDLDPSNSDTLIRLGHMASDRGDTTKVHDIHLALLGINQEIADEFAKNIGCNKQC